ncbi:hypothetical protein [Escherichia coli]|uniref:hypothetical protein n=1 Tax=Escherichia coli TaxID=562 RepID=UPI003013DF25
MDIIHLLEVLRPANNVITLRVENFQSNTKATIDYIILLAPIVVAIFGMILSYSQFSKNLKNQSKQFSKTIQQQIQNVHLTAKLAAEVEAIKEVKKEVRKLSVDFITCISQHRTDMYEYETLRNRPVNIRTEDHANLVDLAHRVRMNSFSKMLETKSMLETYLNADDDRSFIDAMIEVENAMRDYNDEGVRLGKARGLVIVECRKYLENKNQEIDKLTSASITQ